MKPKELNQQELSEINGGFLGGLLGDEERDPRSDSNGHDNEDRSYSSGLLGDVPLIGDIL